MTSAPPSPRYEAVLLGNAQDAGVPQTGCTCARCLAARRDPARRRFAACLGLVDHAARAYWLIDATPDLREQVHALLGAHPGYALAGIALTHAHAGHYTGLVHLGKEGWSARGVPLFATDRMLAFLRGHEPWATLARDHLAPRTLAPGRAHALAPGLALVAVEVPHRDEFSDTVAYVVRGPARAVFYCPDVDHWDGFDLGGTLDAVDDALLDATFHSADELPGRDLATIPHPLAPDTARAAAGHRARPWLVHLNHSNPLHDPGPEREALAAHGARVAEQGQRWGLG